MTTILVIDDQAEVGEAITEIFAETDVTVLAATSGPAGLALAAARDPHLILLDHDMPGMDRPAVLRRLREDSALRCVPVVALTGRYAAAAPALVGGCVGYIAKPFDSLAGFRALVLGFLAATRRRDASS